MDPVDALRGLGGSARWAALKGHVSRRALARSVAEGDVLHLGRSYALPGAGRDVRLAQQLRAVRSHTSAARHHGLALPPDCGDIDLTIGRRARRLHVPDDVDLHYREHSATEKESGVTDPVCTVLDCLRDEPLRTALSVGDSALHCEKVDRDILAARVAALRGAYSARVKSRFRLLDGRVANAFESCCRAILLAAGVTGFEPQVTIRYRGMFVGRVDLAHHGLRIVIECDGFEFHGGRDAFVSDLVRHTNLTAAGWRTLRFTWQQVMFHPEWVLQRVLDAIASAERAPGTAEVLGFGSCSGS